MSKRYSRDGDRQLKQFNIGLGVAHRGVSVVEDIFDEESADTTRNKELISEICQCLSTDESIICVGDSKAVTGENLARASEQNLPVISRLPGMCATVDELIDRPNLNPLVLGVEEVVEGPHRLRDRVLNFVAGGLDGSRITGKNQPSAYHTSGAFFHKSLGELWGFSPRHEIGRGIGLVMRSFVRYLHAGDRRSCRW